MLGTSTGLACPTSVLTLENLSLDSAWGAPFFLANDLCSIQGQKKGGLAEINQFFSFVQPKNNKAKRKTTSEIAD